MQNTLCNVDFDRVPVANRGDWSANSGFRSDMADHQSSCRGGKATIGEQSHRLAQTRASKCGRDRKHFAHARSATRCFVTDHQYISRLDFVALDSSEVIVFAIEISCGIATLVSMIS